MDGVRLYALQDVHSTTGKIRAGKEFTVTHAEAQRYLQHGVATTDPKAANLWSGPDWSDCEVVIIASGPSLTQEDCDKVRLWRKQDTAHRKVIVINTSFRLAPFADALYACDGRWWREYGNEVDRLAFCGALWTQDNAVRNDMRIKQIVKSEPGRGLCRTPGVVNQGQNSGYQCIGLAYHTGAQKIYLLGYDMQETNGKKHWHPDHPGTLNAKARFEYWLGFFDQLAADLKKEGITVINITRQSALNVFPKKSLEEVLV